jgi:hypothetical protein
MFTAIHDIKKEVERRDKAEKINADKAVRFSLNI